MTQLDLPGVLAKAPLSNSLRFLSVVVLCLCQTACSGAISGTPLIGADFPKRTHAVISVSTAEADGLRVLYKGDASAGELEQSGWIAGTALQLAALWWNVGVRIAPPTVDFSKYVVVGVAGGGGICPYEVVGFTVDANSVLTLRYATGTTCASMDGKNCSCSDVLTRVAEVVALPRRSLGKRFEFVNQDAAFRFDVPDAENAPDHQLSQAGIHSTESGRAELLELPPLGHMSLRVLHNRSEVWVVHDRDGTISIIASSLFREDAEYWGGTRQWNAKFGRFIGDYDAHGRSVQGLAPLQKGIMPIRGYAWTRHDNSHVLVAGTIAIPPGPIQPREQAPILDGPNAAYSTMKPVASWNSLADGSVGLLDLDMILSPSSGVHLCRAPRQNEPLDAFAGCSPDAPFLGKYPSSWRDGDRIIYGPFVVLRQGSRAKVLGEPPTKGPPQSRSFKPQSAQ